MGDKLQGCTQKLVYTHGITTGTIFRSSYDISAPFDPGTIRCALTLEGATACTPHTQDNAWAVSPFFRGADALCRCSTFHLLPNRGDRKVKNESGAHAHV